MIDSGKLKVVAAMTLAGALAACSQAESPAAGLAPAATSSSIELTAGIQDIMHDMIEPSAEFLWESVGVTETAEGVEEKQPRTDEEWAELRRHSIIIAESANLILMNGRHVVREGKLLDDHGTPGNLTAEQVEQAIAADRATFESFGRALHEVGVTFLKAAEKRDTKAIMDAGETMDEVCEGCHLKFWYPGQKIPAFPDQAPE
ncbi:hypothetical protein JM946_23400 [Steroidobacter sp. S1-65]|uniref:Cytochrome c n=1 Tax=Steroidobacter gossypii TaxID=2805490 RepID=A0ABS1X3A2_9GAMM|nr:hypothetical protein [Steroidobacter gossypii]MBM0107701.1 hypothetical protein [Steroidobacter gossypii]